MNGSIQLFLAYLFPFFLCLYPRIRAVYSGGLLLASSFLSEDYRSSPLSATAVCVYYCSTYYKAVREGGGNGGHVLRETTSRGRCELVCPSRTNERGGEGYCVKEGEGEEGERERERAGEVRLYYSLGY